MANREKFKTKSGIKVERNRTISPNLDLPKIKGSDDSYEGQLSISPETKRREETQSPDALAERLAQRKSVPRQANAPKTTKPKQKAPGPANPTAVNIKKVNLNIKTENQASP